MPTKIKQLSFFSPGDTAILKIRKETDESK